MRTGEGLTCLLLAGLLACSGNDAADAAPARAGSASNESAALQLAPEARVVFVEAESGFMTDEVYDADREVVFFDGALGAIVSSETGAIIVGWQVDGVDLDWSRFGVPFRVRFGTEQGERRAYFTEAGPGTICNLRFIGADQLSISATSETPPNP